MSVHHIVIGVDGSAGSRAALGWAAELAAQLDAHITAVHVFEPLAQLGEIEPPYDMAALATASRHQLDEWVAPLAEMGISHDVVFTEGAPGERLSTVADDIQADLIVVGDRGNSGLSKLLFGSTALELPRSTTRPVTVIRSEG